MLQLRKQHLNWSISGTVCVPFNTPIKVAAKHTLKLYVGYHTYS